MLGDARTFEDRDYGPHLGSEAVCRTPPELKAPTGAAPVETIAPRIEVDILFRRVVCRWHREAAAIGLSVCAVRCHPARAHDQQRTAVCHHRKTARIGKAMVRPRVPCASRPVR
jgi:hypothetical protein